MTPRDQSCWCYGTDLSNGHEVSPSQDAPKSSSRKSAKVPPALATSGISSLLPGLLLANVIALDLVFLARPSPKQTF